MVWGVGLIHVMVVRIFHSLRFGNLSMTVRMSDIRHVLSFDCSRTCAIQTHEHDIVVHVARERIKGRRHSCSFARIFYVLDLKPPGLSMFKYSAFMSRSIVTLRLAKLHVGALFCKRGDRTTNTLDFPLLQSVCNHFLNQSYF